MNDSYYTCSKCGETYSSGSEDCAKHAPDDLTVVLRCVGFVLWLGLMAPVKLAAIAFKATLPSTMWSKAND
jgi:hypothetical protein